MDFGIVIALIIGLFVFAFGSFGWSQIKRHGAKEEEHKQIKKALKYANKTIEVSNRPPLTANQQLAALLRLRDRSRRR